MNMGKQALISRGSNLANLMSSQESTKKNLLPAKKNSKVTINIILSHYSN